MGLLTDSMLAYTLLDNALQEIVESVKDVKRDNYTCFCEGKGNEDELPNLVRSIKELRKSMAKFNNLFEDYVNELQQAEFESWEENEADIEQDYYQGETTNGRVN